MSTYGKYLIFPEHIVEDSAGGGDSGVVVIDSEGDEFRVRRGAKRRRRITLNGCKMTPQQHDEFLTFCDLTDDEFEPFLFRDIRRCKLVNEPIGVGDGATKTFQLAHTRSLQGRSKTTPVLYPDHDYPARYFPGDTRQYWPRAGNSGLVEITVNDAPAALDTSTQEKLDALRYGGVVTLQNAPANGALVKANCYFYLLLRFNNGGPLTKPEGGGAWTFAGGLELIEPKGGR